MLRDTAHEALDAMCLSNARKHWLPQVLERIREIKGKGKWRETRWLLPGLVWVVNQSCASDVPTDFFGNALPLLFPLIEDFEEEVQAVGLTLLRSLLMSVTPTEVTWHMPLILKIMEHGLRFNKTPRELRNVLDCIALTLLMSKPESPQVTAGRLLPKISLIPYERTTCSCNFYGR